MSVFALSQQQIRDAVAAEVRAATDALEARITALERQILDVVQPTRDPEPSSKAARKPRGTTAGAQTAAASGSSN